jgi:alkaline phosphatase D
MGAALLVPVCAPSRKPPDAAPAPGAVFEATHGVAAGDVTGTRAVIWSRTARYSAMHVTVESGGHARHQHFYVTEGRDFTGKATFTALTPDTRYRYSVGFTPSEAVEPEPAHVASGIFQTAPDSNADRDVTFGWSGDLGGLNVCRDKTESYPIFRTIDGSRLSFFIGLGDMVYADMACKERGLYGNDQIPTPVAESTTVRQYWAHWKYNREDAGLRRLLASTAYYGVWDDHEVANDFSPNDAWHRFPPYTIGADLLPLGRRALQDYNPIFEDPSAPNRFYGKYRWGKHLDLIVLDTRSYRDDDFVADDAARPKTMLGRQQREWFEKSVLESDATWKVVVSSVPIAIPTGRGAPYRDGWADYDGKSGNERELTDMFRKFRDAQVRRLVFITTDVHFATGLVYTPFPETPDFRVLEFSSGPLTAMLLPTHSLDSSLHPERLFFFGPPEQPHSWNEAKRFMNWGRIEVARSGSLSVSILDGLGAEVARTALAPDGSPPAERVPL